MSIRGALTDRERMHELVRRFETRVAADLGGTWAVAVSSASTGLLASLLAVGVSPGQDVLVPGLSWPGTWYPAALLGARLVPIDLAEGWFAMDPTVAEAALQHRTAAAVVSVGLFGSAVGVAEVDEVARAAGVPHILDAAQLLAPGGPGGDLGTLADLVVISLGPEKPAACGGGGAVLGSDPRLRDRLLLLTQHPVRMYTDTDDVSLLPFADGFGSNFQIHPAAARAYLRLQPDAASPRTRAELASASAILRAFGALPLLPPPDWRVAGFCGARLFGTVPPSGVGRFGVLRAALEDAGWMAERCRYAPFDEVAERRAALYPWIDATAYPLRRAGTRVPRARRWARELLILTSPKPQSRRSARTTNHATATRRTG